MREHRFFNSYFKAAYELIDDDHFVRIEILRELIRLDKLEDKRVTKELKEQHKQFKKELETKTTTILKDINRLEKEYLCIHCNKNYYYEELQLFDFVNGCCCISCYEYIKFER